MILNTVPVTTPPAPAATVVVLRNGPSGLEVLLVRRHDASDAFGGAYVFPGGKLDADDSSALRLARLRASAETLHTRLGEPELDAATAAGLFFAACRETFEEASILFGRCAQAQLAQAYEQASAGTGFGEMLERLDLHLDADDLVPWTRWITPRVPSMARRRFDTRFFVTLLPEGQQPRHDEHEATESVWLSPRAALQRYWNREILLAPPQIMSLSHLSRHADVASVLAEARRRTPPLIEPSSLNIEGGRILLYPGDAEHSVTARAMPGPTRMTYRDGRFEPAGGLEGWFA